MNYALEPPREDHIWDFYYELLLGFVDRKGHADILKQHIEKGFALGIWVHKQRDNRKFLRPDRIAALEEIEGWFWDDEPSPAIHPNPFFRADLSRGEPSRGPDDAKTETESVPVDSKPPQTIVNIDSKNSANQNTWESRFQLLLKFGRREGHHRVPSRHVEDGVKLGTWVVNLRRKAEKLHPDQYKRLDSLQGWEWDPREAKWLHYYKLLQKYVAGEGHAMVPKVYFENGSNLGLWVSHQRDHYRRGELANHRISQLEKVNGWQWLGEQEEISDTEMDNLAQEAWTTLFGLGTLAENAAAHTAVKKLHNAGMVGARHARPGSLMHATILKAFERNIELGIMDRPAEGKIRAVLTNPEFYEDEDWDMCIEATLTDAPTNREAAMEAAAHWAKCYSGLDFDGFKPGDAIHDSLSAALRRAIEKRIAIRLPRGMVRKIHG